MIGKHHISTTTPESQGVQGCFSQRSKARRCSSAKPRLRRPCPDSPARLKFNQEKLAISARDLPTTLWFRDQKDAINDLSVESTSETKNIKDWAQVSTVTWKPHFESTSTMVSFPGTCNAYLLADVLPATQIESEETSSSSMGSSASQICKMTSIPSVPLWQSHVRKSILLQVLYLVVLNYTNKLLWYVWYSCSSMSDEPLVWDVHWRDSAVLTFTHLLLGPQKTSPFQNSVLKASTDQQNWEPKRFIVSTHQHEECPSSRDAKAKSIKMHRES